MVSSPQAGASTTGPANPTPAAPASSSPRAAGKAGGATEPAHHAGRARGHHEATSASIDVDTTSAGEVYLDDQFRGNGPQHLAVEPGPHLVRVEGSANGLRLVPKEITVDLKAGESRKLRLEPQ
jgi:hypothetical protein